MRILAFVWTAILTFALSVNINAQILTPVKWETEHKQISNTEFDLVFTATMDDGWSIYSQYLESDDGPVRTSFEFENGEYVLVEKNQETGNKKEGYDELFDMNVIKFSKEAVFTQRVKINGTSAKVVGYLEFMTCDATRCLPPEAIDFDFTLAAAKTGSTETPINIETDKGEEKVATTTPPVIEKPTTTPAPTTTQKPTATTPTKIAKKPTLAQNKVATQTTTLPVTSKTKGTEIETETPTETGILDPVKWSMNIKKINEQEYDLIYHTKIDKGWHTYSQYLDRDDGPQATMFEYDPNETLELVGKNEETGPKKSSSYDEFFDMTVTKFKESATFTQRVKVTDPTQPIKGFLLYMACESGRCLPPTDVGFWTKPSTLEAYTGAEADAKINGPTIAMTPSVADAKAVPLGGGLMKIDKNNPAGICSTDTAAIEDDTNLSTIFMLGFFGGLLALLTPCVFPMIPLTVSFFTKGSENKSKGLRDALLYGSFIFLVYLVLSIPFHLMDSLNPDILNNISTNVWLNIAFFIIFVFFAGSFFGYYELTLPSSWLNKASGAENIGGIVGIFFMALTLALVSFSCTGPILGSLLAGSLTSDGGAWQLTSGMGGFGLALALPFAIFAMFPRWMNSLPQSGSWLTTVKVVLGFLELALAFKFLSNADLVKHWGLLKIEPFLIIEIIIFLGLALYLFGKIKFPHDAPITKLAPLRLITGSAALAFAVYLATGFMYNEKTNTFSSLTLLSGLAPPVGYSWIYPKDCPNDLDCFKDLETGLAYAKEKGKPVMLDFTGYACVNCRKMEEHVWPINSVEKYLKEDFVLISLYVDDRKELPKEEQIMVKKATGGERKLRNYGNKWAYIQTELVDDNSQPFYVLLSPEGKLLNKPVGYTPDVDQYTSFLECGLNNYQNLKNRTGMK